MTVPYSAFLLAASSALTETGHKQMRAMKAKTNRRSEEAGRGEWGRVRRDMVVYKRKSLGNLALNYFADVSIDVARNQYGSCD